MRAYPWLSIDGTPPPDRWYTPRAMPWKLLFPSGVSTFLSILSMEARILLFFRRPGGTYTPNCLILSETAFAILLQIFVTRSYETPAPHLFDNETAF